MIKILIIDDDKSIRDISGKVLGKAGYGMEMAETAEEGLIKCETGQFDLVVTDLSLPGMDGAKLSEVLREKYPKLKILIFSGLLSSLDGESSVKLIEKKGLKFLPKPFRPKELLSAVAAMLQ